MKIRSLAHNALVGTLAVIIMGTGVGIPAPAFSSTSNTASSEASESLGAVESPSTPAEPSEALTEPSESATPSPSPSPSVSPSPVETAQATQEANTGIHVSKASSANLKLASPLKAKSYRVSSHFGNRCAPVLGAAFYHGATDMAAPDGTPLYAMLDGKIDSVVQGSSTVTGTIRVDHGTVNGKKLLVSYGHMWDVYKYVKVGQKVKKGQQISEVGSSGVSNGAHLHMAVQYGGKWVDPVPLLKGWGLDLHKNATSVATKNIPKVCNNMYVSADMGLKKSANMNSDTLAVLKRNSLITVTPGVTTNGYIAVKDNKSGKKGYLTANTINNKSSSAPKLPKTSKVSANVRYTPSVTQHVRSYPSTRVGESGVLDTLSKGELFTTTGRKAGSYTEIKFKLGTGWIASSVMLSAPDPAKLKTKSVKKNYIYTPNASANLFSYPDSSSKVYKEYTKLVKKGNKLKTTGKGYGSYLEVTYSNKKYWVHSSYVHRTTPALPKLTNTTKNVPYKAKATTALRNYPSTSSASSWSLRSMPKNSLVKTTGKKYNSWIQVKNGSKTGWVKTSQMTRQRASLPKLTNMTKNIPYKVKTSTAQLRNYPSTSETQGWNLRTMKKGAALKTTGKKYGSWYQVKNGSKTGWVQKSKMSRQTAKLPKTSKRSKNVYYKSKGTAKIRNYPHSSATKGWNIKTVKKNWKMTTTGRKYGSWTEVKSGSTKGWILNSKISRTSAPLPKTKSTKKNVTWKAKSTQKLMSYPSTSMAKGLNVKTIKKNGKVKTTGKKYGSWVSVKSGSKKGWINTKKFKR